MHPSPRFKNHLLLAALASAYPVLGHTAAAARVEFVVGNVSAVASNGGKRPLERGSELNSGETINTGDGRAQLRFADGGMMSLQPQTEFRIDEYKYDGKVDGKERSFFSLLRGGLRTISGLIGHGNRDNYRVTTSVATIGIRGTEWSGTLAGSGDDAQLNLSTGEGAIEVCNAAGCLTVASGESAIVTGNAQPKRTDVKPSLPPSSVNNPPPSSPIYSQAENRTASGDLVIGPATTKSFSSGSGYSMAWVGQPTGETYASDGTIDLGSMTFDPNPSANPSKAQSSSDLLELGSGGSVLAAVDSTGTIGWGIWSKAVRTYTGDGISITPMDDVHFVVGKGTSDLSAIKGMTATYKQIGSTTPVSTLGPASVQSAALTAYFSGWDTTLDLSMSVKAGSRVYSASANDMSMTGTSTFSGNGTATWQSGEDLLYVSGLFAGTNASHAGIAYSISGDGLTKGAIAFERDTLVTPKFTSGSGFSLAMLGVYDCEGPCPIFDSKSATTASFDSTGGLTAGSATDYSFTSPTSVSQVGVIADKGDPVLGWGKWTGGTATYLSDYSLNEAHYIVGKETSASDFNAMSGTYTYSKVGGTTPSSELGTATLNSASLSATFSAGSANVSFAVNASAGGRTFDATGSTVATSSRFEGSGSGSVTGGGTASLDFKGIFAGANAKHAGVVYQLSDVSDGKQIRGAVGLSR